MIGSVYIGNKWYQTIKFRDFEDVVKMENKKYLGVMVDCSRNAVLTVSAAKRLIDALHKMGYNMLMLYTEDTYEVDNQPKFGYLRGRYTKEELKEIVAYGEQNGVELIPCIQTLAHLNQIFRYPEYKEINDCGDILLVDDERTYKLIDDMFSTLRQCYKTPWVHIGMDEAHDLGKGKYRDIHGEQNRFDILKRHLEKVTEIAQKYGFKPMMWSDMFFRLATKGEYYINDPDIITPEIAACAPENVGLVYWDYYHSRGHYDIYDSMVKAHKKFNNPIWFAGGAWTWTGFAPHNKMAVETTAMAMASCRDNGVDNIFMTCWGDNGGECSVFSVLPTLFYAAEVYRGNENMELIAKRFEDIFKIGFEDFMKLDYPAAVSEEYRMTPANIDRVLIFNDPFCGIADNLVAKYGDVKELYLNYAEELRRLENAPEYGYLFKYSAALCELLAVKTDLGIRTRKAYEAKDKAALTALLEDYELAERKVDEFYSAYRKAWLHDKKGTGLEVQAIRFGGLKMRLNDCRIRLEEYINGEIDTIDDLDQKLIYVHGSSCFNWGKIVSNNNIN